jgi:Tol biopolymer transport system component
LKISVADGQIHELVSLKTGWMRYAAFSPDGRFVAYQVQPSSAADPVSRIFILPAEGGEPQLAYEERPSAGISRNRQPLRLLDWTADGRYLAIASERTGKGSLHLLPMKDGKQMGAPVFVKYGDFEYGSTTAAGGLIYDAVKPGGVWAVYTASLEASGRPGAWKRLDLPLGNTTNPWPEWSGDSNQIVYVGRNEDSGQTGGEVVHLRDLSTSEDREIYHALGHTTCTWAVQEPKLFCADNRAEKTDILSIAIESGQVERLHTSPAPLAILYPSRDDLALYLSGGNEEEEILRLDIATGQETTLERFPSGVWGLVSPDERWLIRKGAKGADIRPMSGGDWKALVSSNTSAQDSAAPDGNWLFYRDADAAGKKGLYRVATAGGQPERMGDFPTNSNGGGTMEISPDGRKIMVAGMFDAGWELWSLENFVPPAPKP